MKRLLISLFVFSLSLGLGVVTAWIVLTESNEALILETQVENSETTAMPTSDTSNEFDPEFLNVEESEYDGSDDLRLLNRLIHVSGTEIFRRSEVVAKNGEAWFVLTKEGNRYSVRKSTARVRKLNSISWPGDEKDAKLTYRVRGKPIIALSNIRGIRPGSVQTLFFDKSRLDADEIIQNERLSKGYRREFILNDRLYTLRVTNALSTDGVDLTVLALESEGSTQILEQTRRHLPGEELIIGDLLWVGDLDRDGKLDLYFDHFNEIGAFSSGLYLSSHAESGKLVDLVAVFGTAGC